MPFTKKFQALNKMSAMTFFLWWFFSLNGHWQTDVNMWVSFTLSLILLIDWNNLSFYNNVNVKSTCRGNLRDSMFETIWNISGPWVSPYWVVVVVEGSWASYLDHLSVRVFTVKVTSQNSNISWHGPFILLKCSDFSYVSNYWYS